jgi:WD40 repeat protein
VDSTNTRLVSAGAGDGLLRIWGFKQQQLMSELDVGAPVTHLVLHAWSGLAAVAKADLEVVLLDIEAVRVVRRFKGHK